MGKPVLVIGGGLGGLSAAICLAAAGNRVRLLEKNEQLGGKCNRRTWNGFHFDTGPSLLTMPFVVDELFAKAGRRREDYLDFLPVTPACRYFFSDGSVFDAPGTLAGFREAVAEQYPEDREGFDRFMAFGQRLWDVSGSLFLFNRISPGLLTKIRPRHAMAGLVAMRPWTLRQAVEHFFQSPNLRQLFSRYATYNGSDPWRTPATFNVISYVEMAFGSWHIRGGIYKLVQALTQLATELGVEIETATAVERICFQGDRVVGVDCGTSRVIPAEKVIVNADAVAALTGRLCADHPRAEGLRAKWAHREASSSGAVQLLAVEGTHDQLSCHNIFFNEDYRNEFRDLFGDPRPLRDPTIYIAAPCKMDRSQAPAGSEAWFVLVNAPDTVSVPEWPEDYDAKIIDRLASSIGSFDPGNIRWSQSLPPTFLRDEYGAWRGSIYGPSSNDRRAAFLRLGPGGPAKGLFFTGGSAHPGGGIPLVLTSGRLAAEMAD